MTTDIGIDVEKRKRIWAKSRQQDYWESSDDLSLRGYWHLARDALDLRDMVAKEDCQGGAP